MFIALFIVFLSTDMCKAHVFCQDTHVSRWTPLGYSCPVNCASVVEAVKRLKEIDFEEFLKMQQMHHISNFSLSSDEDTDIQNKPQRRDIEIKESKQPSPAHYRELYKVLLNKRSGNELQALCKIASARLKDNDMCRSSNRTGVKQKRITKKCAKKSVIEEDFLKKFTEILNKHSSSELFSEDLTATILKQLIGKSVDIRLGRFDAPSILSKVRQALSDLSKQARAGGAVATLQSKYCLNVYVPGCFCIPGYVEANGECVLPRDCFPASDNSINEYLSRVIVN